MFYAAGFVTCGDFFQFERIMKGKNLLYAIFSIRVSLGLLLFYAVALAAATWIEKEWGSQSACTLVYHSPFLFLLQFFLVLGCAVTAVRHGLLHPIRWGFLLTHTALALVLLGALVTYCWGKEGVIHVREGCSSDLLQLRHGNEVSYERLPFSIELKDFILTRYPGSASPSSYESRVRVHIGGETLDARIYMNKVLDVNGFRFFQASYDADEQGSVLAVNYDVPGRTLTYTGYFLLGIGLIVSLVAPRSRFRRLADGLKAFHRVTAWSIVFLLASFGGTLPVRAQPAVADAREVVLRYQVPADHAARFGLLPMQSVTGRMMPVNTFASEVLRKLHKSDRVYGHSPDQFMISLITMPDVWMQVPLIAIPSPALSDRYGLGRDYCSYSQVFDESQHYKLQADLEEAYRKSPSTRTRFDKDLLKLDEQINVFHQLINRQRLNLFPLEGDRSHKWYAQGDDLSVYHGKDSLFVARILDWYAEEVSEAMRSGRWEKAGQVLDMINTYQQAKEKTLDISRGRMKAEWTYNSLNVFGRCKSGYLILGVLLLVCAVTRLFTRWPLRYMEWLLGLVVTAVFAFHTYGIGLRWYISGYAPWSNSYETMVYVAWVSVLAGLVFARRSVVAFALGTIFSGVILFVSGLSWMDPQISPLVPVLKSPWLMFHVAVIVAAYGFLGLGCLLGLTNLSLLAAGRFAVCRKAVWSRLPELTVINEMILWIGLSLLTVGTFLGAVWANESWGRYWGWDPKETWALVTLVLYATVTHLHLLPLKRPVWVFNTASVWAFTSVLMTFFGVNYFLSGMHSYGENEHIDGLFPSLLTAGVLVLALTVFSARGEQQALGRKDICGKQLSDK